MLDPRSAAKLNLMFIAFAFAVAPVAFGSAAGCALAGHRLISYWWLALTLRMGRRPVGDLRPREPLPAPGTRGTAP
jgi:hypothetical protein